MNKSELILNPDGSIYHLALLPEDIAPTIILVGDQDRVESVSRHFEKIDVKKQRREFVTHTGWISGKRLTVISTGIGTDNIDIVINELDALVNIDFTTRTIKSNLTTLSFIRIGTSGSVNDDLHVGDFLLSRVAIGIDALGTYYKSENVVHPLLPAWSYIARAYDFNLDKVPTAYKQGITLTCPGFYGPQGRSLRLQPDYNLAINELGKIFMHGHYITNIEMETAGIYLLAELLGHRAISFNAILAHRIHGKFIENASSHIDELISAVLEWITSETERQ